MRGRHNSQSGVEGGRLIWKQAKTSGGFSSGLSRGGSTSGGVSSRLSYRSHRFLFSPHLLLLLPLPLLLLLLPLLLLLLLPLEYVSILECCFWGIMDVWRFAPKTSRPSSFLPERWPRNLLSLKALRFLPL